MEQKTATNGGSDRAANIGSRKRARAFPKGRQLDGDALREVRQLLGSRPRRPDLLIEFLHLIQDRYHHLSARHLRALCEEMRLPQASVYEVATFYSHFDVVKEGETPPPPTTIRVCDSITCELKGAEALLDALEAHTDPAKVRVLRAACMGRCDTAPVCEIGHLHVDNATVESVEAAVASGQREATIPPYQNLAEYLAAGGYSVLASCRSGERSFDSVVKELADASLRGLGGAGFPTGRKWQIVRSYPGPRLMTINGDEGEPGTFKDRYYLERQPHSMFEGALIGAWGVEAERIYLYMRDEYPAVLHILAHEIAALEKAGFDRARPDRAPPRRRSLYLRRRVGDDRVRSKGSAAIRATVRPISPRSACSGVRPSIRTSRRSIGCLRSWPRAANGLPTKASMAARACAPGRCRGG